MKKVSIVGSGNVGANAAFFVAEMAAAHVNLVDVEEGRARGKALDLMEAAPIRRYRTFMTGSDDMASLAGSEIVVLAAGKIREPGQDRTAHFQVNKAIVEQISAAIVEHCPGALLVVATEPVDAMVKLAVQQTGIPREKVMGIGGVLDSTRMASFVAERLSISPRDVDAMVIGSHTHKMVPLRHYTRVSGIEVASLMDEAVLGQVLVDTREAGSVIVDLAKQANAFYAPSSAIAQVIEAMAIDTKKILPLSVLLQGEYGMEDVALSVPCKLGADGVEQIIELDLNEETRMAFQASAEPIRDLV